MNLQIATPIQGESQIFVSSNPEADEILDSTLNYTSPEDVIDFVFETKKSFASSFSLYPNPCKSELNIVQNTTSADGTVMTIFDVTGRSVRTEFIQSSSSSIDTSALPEGLYSVRLNKNGRVESQSFIKH